MLGPLGFNNTYALGMRADTAQRLGITKISDLVQHPELRFGFSNEFMNRGDGWPALRDSYRLPQTQVNGLDHDVAYRGVVAGAIEVIDLYATDAEIAAPPACACCRTIARSFPATTPCCSTAGTPKRAGPRPSRPCAG